MAVVDSYILMFTAWTESESNDWRELEAFVAVSRAIDEIEFALTNGVEDSVLFPDAMRAVLAFQDFHRLDAWDDDGEFYQELDDAMVYLGANHFGRSHARP
jgi:hypothetical protein